MTDPSLNNVERSQAFSRCTSGIDVPDNSVVVNLLPDLESTLFAALDLLLGQGGRRLRAVAD
jgi:hypothetical protein